MSMAKPVQAEREEAWPDRFSTQIVPKAKR